MQNLSQRKMNLIAFLCKRIERRIKGLRSKRLQRAVRSGGIAPSSYVQTMAESFLHLFVASKPEDVKLIIVVGASTAEEVSVMLSAYPLARFILFEPSPLSFPRLRRLFADSPNVVCVQKAVAEISGQAELFETTLSGNGSLFRLGFASKRDYGVQQSATYTVEVTTLDEYLRSQGLGLLEIDMLWCDVQGAELKVLQGARESLGRCRALHLEVSAWERMYEQACLQVELEAVLIPAGFTPVLSGLDPLNGTGNVFYVHPCRRGKLRRGL